MVKSSGWSPGTTPESQQAHHVRHDSADCSRSRPPRAASRARVPAASGACGQCSVGPARWARHKGHQGSGMPQQQLPQPLCPLTPDRVGAGACSHVSWAPRLTHKGHGHSHRRCGAAVLVRDRPQHSGGTASHTRVRGQGSCTKPQTGSAVASGDLGSGAALAAAPADRGVFSTAGL